MPRWALFKTDKASVALALINEKNFAVNNYGERVINSIIERVTTDVYLGSGVPAVGLGENGDIYINLAALTYYTKASGAWGVASALGTGSTNTIKLVAPQ